MTELHIPLTTKEQIHEIEQSQTLSRDRAATQIRITDCECRTP